MMKFLTKKVGVLFLSASVLMLFMAYSFIHATPAPEKKKECNGAYTIIEYGIGIDCNGDTVKLVKVHGIQTLAKK